MKTVAILQSNYIPWKGYFDLMASVDEFVILDTVQYTRADWRSRNRIKTPTGTHWLSVPVLSKGLVHQRILDARINGTTWAGKHWRSLVGNYRQAPCFDEIAAWLEPLYLGEPCTHLSTLNLRFIRGICGYLGIDTVISHCPPGLEACDRNERLIEICRQTGATAYVSGPAASGYIDPGRFAEAGIGLSWFDYAGYEQYPQLWGDFVHEVSILDLLFNCGRDSLQYMHHVGKTRLSGAGL